MPETLSAADFEQRVNRLSERMDALRGAPRSAAVSGSTLPYMGLDLTELLPELATVLQALVEQDPDEPVTHNARIEVGGRRLGLALIMSLLVGGEGLADFNQRYQKLMGAEPAYSLFERVLPAAMREAGLPLPAKPEPRRLLEALLATAGLPASLMVATAEYFAIYWRWFYPQPDPLGPMLTPPAQADAETKTSLAALSKRLVPNAAVVVPTVEGLSDLMLFLRSQYRWRVGDLLSASDEIRQASGLDPARLLGGSAEALAVLEGALGHAWTPDQFRHALMRFPRGSEVRLPNGSLAMVDKAANVPYYGQYLLERKTYLVLPNEGMTLDDVKTLPMGVSTSGNRVFWRAAADVAEPEVCVDSWPALHSPRQVFEERQPLGWLFEHTPPEARALAIGQDKIAPQPGVFLHAGLWATVEGGTPKLGARVALRVCLPELAGTTLQLECPQADTGGRLSFELDERGVGALATRTLPVASPGAGQLELVVQSHETSEIVAHDGRPVTMRLALPEVLLFCEMTGTAIPPGSAVHPFGLPSYLIFATRPVNTGAFQMQDIGVESLGKLGDYEVHRLTWRDANQDLSIHVDGRFQWRFNQRVDDVWQASELPGATPPLAYAPVTPAGLVAASPDHLFVDDVSHVANPIVEIRRDNELLGAYSWDELNWLMNFPTDNRRLSGPMLRRALHVGQDFDLAGRYRLGLRAAGELLGERVVTILPRLDLVVTPSGPQDEEAAYRLVATSAYPCFAGGQKRLAVTLGSPVVDRETMENSPFQPKPLEATLPLAFPPIDLPVSVEPDVIGFRLLDDNEGTWIRKTNLGYDELGHITLVLFARQGEKGTLSLVGGESITEEFYEGFATFPLGTLAESLSEHETDVKVTIDGRSVGTLTVIWHPKVLHFDAANEYLQENVAYISLQVHGPKDVPVRLEATSADGRKLGTLEVEADGDQMRQVAFSLPASRDYPVTSIRVYVPTEQSGVASGSLEVRNASFEPEIEAVNQRITADPQSADLRYERAQLLLARNLRKAAARDFQAAIDLGMTELLDSPQYQQFLGQRRAESFHEDIKALASFFVPFARKELTIG